MTACGFQLLVAVYLSVSFHRGHGSEVVQLRSWAVNPDDAAFISCAYADDVTSVEDVRLYRVSPTNSIRSLLCQKGSDDCHLRNVLMGRWSATDPREWLFVLKAEPGHANATYMCEFTVSNKDNLHFTNRSPPTRLLPGQKETADCEPAASSPSSPQSDVLSWILIGLLALLFLCTCVIACFYIRLRRSQQEYENGTYVEMRKAPLVRNPAVGVYYEN